MRFGGMLTLVEHRRCVPEIIGFSNRVAYEPDGVRLVRYDSSAPTDSADRAGLLADGVQRAPLPR